MSIKFSKLARYYSIIAIFFFSVLILFCLLNLFAWSMLKIDDVFFPIRSVNELKEVYPGMSSSDISLLLDETQKRPYEYEPWLGFKERERAGKYVNISRVY